jgi:hypothetical protein
MGGPEKEFVETAYVERGPDEPPPRDAHRIFTPSSPLLHDRELSFAQELWTGSAGPFGIDADPG